MLIDPDVREQCEHDGECETDDEHRAVPAEHAEMKSEIHG